jgi:hypothetical protein
MKEYLNSIYVDPELEPTTAPASFIMMTTLIVMTALMMETTLMIKNLEARV